MAMRAFQIPWWVSLAYSFGLIFIFVGQRVLGGGEGAASLLTWLGVAAMLGATGLRLYTGTIARGPSKKVELLTVLAYAGGLAAMGLYALTTQWGIDLVGLTDAEPETVTRFTTPMTVLWLIVLLVSLVTLLFIEMSQGVHDRNRFSLAGSPESEGVVETYRVRQGATAGLSIGLALSFLFVTCQAAEEYDIRKDVSYFKTSSPGSATKAIVGSVSEPLTVYLFFPDVNEVKDEVERYFEALARQTGKVEVKHVERFREIDLTKKFKVNKDGTIVIERGDKHEKFTVSEDIEQARRKQLRTLDETVQKSLLKVVRAKRVAYLTTGHGELNDPDSVGALGFQGPKVKATLIKEALRRLNYQVKDLAPFDLAGTVPDDATMVISLAPRRPFAEREEQAMADYLNQGGALLLAMDTYDDAGIGDTLAGVLGVRFANTVLADDKEYIPSPRMNASDHVRLKTNQFSAHASVTTLSRRGSRLGMALIRSGYLEDVPFESKDERKAKRTYVVRSMSSAFADEDGDFVFDKGSEKRQRYNIVAAIEDPSAVKTDAKEGEVQPREGMRAMVLADADVFADAILVKVPLAQDLLFDSLKWLGGEERFAGETKNEEDKLIEHTKAEDKVYFYLTLLLAPMIILAIGLLVNRIRRRRIARRAS